MSAKKITKKVLATSKEKTANSTTDYPAIPVEHAIESTQIWCNFNEDLHQLYNFPEDYIRAFFIPAADIEAMHNMFQADANLIGCRVYLGMTPYMPQVLKNIPREAPIGGTMKLFMVAVEGSPTIPNGIDVVYSPDTNDSLVYDFTSPCPSTCDMVSVLYHSGAGEVHSTIKKTEETEENTNRN